MTDIPVFYRCSPFKCPSWQASHGACSPNSAPESGTEAKANHRLRLANVSRRRPTQRRISSALFHASASSRASDGYDLERTGLCVLKNSVVSCTTFPVLSFEIWINVLGIINAQFGELECSLSWKIWANVQRYIYAQPYKTASWFP